MMYTKDNPLRVFTSFSGYDSQCLALNRIGIPYELVGWCEIDKYAIQAHNALFPQWADRNYGDITKIDWAQVPDFDLFTYSSPCQDFSSAGLQRGGEEGSGTRSSLLWECKRAIKAKHPRYLLQENVKALVSQKFIKQFRKWQIWLESEGYDNFAKVLNATDFNVPQNRERIFMVSCNDGMNFEFPKPLQRTRFLDDLAERDIDDKYYLSEKSIEGFRKHNERHEAKGTGFIWKPKEIGGGKEIANCLMQRMWKQGATDNTLITYGGGQIANTLRANAALNATDNSILERYGKVTEQTEEIPAGE